MMNLLDRAFPASAITARSIRQALNDACARLTLPPGPVQDLVTAASEIVNNIIEHSAAPAATEVRVRLTLTVDTLTLSLEDDGSPFTGFGAATQLPALNPFEDTVEEGGYGLFLIRRLFPDHVYTPGPPNSFQLSRNLARRRLRLLLVEDETTLRRLYESMLIPFYDVVGCTTAAEAQALAKLTRPDLLLCDINLPDRTGLDLLAQLARDPSSPPVPIIVFSGSRTPEVEARASRLGIDDFLEKPVSRALLLKTIERALGRARRDRAQMLGHMHSRLTQSIAPAAPTEIGGFRCALATRPVSVGGGDMVMTLTPAAGGECLLVGDVMGHGLQAKLMAHALAGYVRGLVHGLGETLLAPPDLLARLATTVADDRLLQECLMTALILEPRGPGQVRITNAGHPDPILLAATPRVLDTQAGPLIGLVRAPEYSPVQIALAPGDRLLIATDGVLPMTAATGHADEILQVLTPILDDLRGLPLDQAVQAATAFLETLELSDDWTLLLMEPAAAA